MSNLKLSERAVLVALHIGTWSGSMHDGDVSDEVSVRKKASKTAGRYNKQLVDRSLLRDVVASVSKAGTLHRTLSLPWADDARILHTMGHTHYTNIMRACRVEFENAVASMLKLYPRYIGSLENKARLGQLYDASDYPTVDELEKKFYYDVEVKQVPDVADFRAKLSDATVKAVVKDIERRGEERVKAALNSVFERIAGHAEHMMKRLRDYKPAEGSGRADNIFKDSLIYNVKELAELLPGLNITGDPRIEALQKQLMEQLVANPPEILRTDNKTRLATAAKAEEILKKVKEYMA